MLQQQNAFLCDSLPPPPNLIIPTTTTTTVRRQHQPNIKTQQLPNGDSRVIRSEVWNCFDLEGLNAVCRACNERLKVGPTRQT